MTHRHPAIEAVILVLLIGALGHVRVQPPVAPSDKADALSEAARKGDAAAVKKLLDEGVEVNTKLRYNRTALSFAADRGHGDVVKLLLHRGPDASTRDTIYH